MRLLYLLLILVVTNVLAQEELVLYKRAFSPHLIEAFEKETGIKVIAKTYQTTKEADNLIYSGEVFDLMLTNHYVLDSWIKDQKLQAIQTSQIHNYGKLNKHIKIKLDPFDKGNKYAVPYLAGVFSISVHKEKVGAIFGKNIPNTWGLLFDDKHASKLASCGIALVSSPLQTYSSFILYKAQMYTFNNSQIKSLTDDLIKLRSFYKYANNERMLNDIKNNQICAALNWSSYKQNSDFIMLEPEEGFPMYVESFVIPATVKNNEAAHKLINFMLKAENAADVVKVSNGIIAVDGVKPLVDENLAKNKLIFPEAKDLQRMFMFPSINNEQKGLLQQEWARFNKF